MNSDPESIQQPQDVPRVFNRKLRWFGMVVGFLAFICLLSFATRSWRYKWSLERAICGADRLVISREFVSPRRDFERGLEINGAGIAVAEIISMIEIDGWRTIPGMVCRCYGDVQIEFRRGDEKLARIAFGHGQSLKWHNGSWFGDATLTQASASAIGSWLNQHAPPMVGPPAPKNGT